MKRATLIPIVLLIAGCATLRGGPSDVELRYEAGVDALARRDYGQATASLEAASQAEDADLARRALLLLATAQLDPQNPDRDPQAAAGIARRLRDGAAPGSIDYIAAETLDRVARETSELHRNMQSARAERDSAWMYIDSLRTRMDVMQTQRDSVVRRAARLEVVGDSLEQELKKTTQELERIRRAIRG